MTTPTLWRTKIHELADMGIEYLIFMAVANEGKAYYDSLIMPAAYDTVQESPVSTIMKTADEFGMKVFMSCGWAIDQFDDPGKTEIREIQIKIMRETADRFSGHKSFYGWYLPCEDSIAPCFPDHAISSINTLASEARKLTPDAKILVSPYGLSLGAVIDGKYVGQLSKMDVDIVAYQDEVGCVRCSTPLETMKLNFSLLRAAHDQVPRIALWANVESFTWEKETNSRDSALIPAAFPRFLSQMAAVSPFADEMVSFIVQGMFDKPGSSMPLGQGEKSIKMSESYMDFFSGKGRWPLLAASFQDRLAHDAIGKPVTLSMPSNSNYDKFNLTNGKMGSADLDDAEWTGFEGCDLDATVDLGQSVLIKTLAARFLQYSKAGINLPSRVDFSVSDNGLEFKILASITPEIWPNNKHDYWIDMAVAENLGVEGRYVRIRATNSGQRLFNDELLVNPEIKM